MMSWQLLVLSVVAFLVRHSAQLRSNHPLHEVTDRVNENGGGAPYVGLVMAYLTEEEALQSSGLFVPNSHIPWLDLSGRRFNIGSIHGTSVIYVMSGQLRLNAGITVQILLDTFDIRGIVHYGIAGSSNNSLSFGDVSVLKSVAFTGAWKWLEFKSQLKGQMPELSFGVYNFPSKGENLLANIEFKPEELYSVGQPMKEVFWLSVDPLWFNIAANLQDLKLQRCVNKTYCLPKTPKVVYGLRGSTADVFVDNAAYRKFLFNEFQVSTVDEESAAVVMTALTNAVPCIVFRGVSDLAGGGGTVSLTSLRSLAAINALNVAVEFIRLISNENLSNGQ